MARSSILGAEPAPTIAPGHDTDLLGPSDSSDSGSDIQGELHLETGEDFESRAAAISGAGNTDPLAGSDASGTGERESAVPEHVRDGADIGFDRVILPAGEALQTDAELARIDDPQSLDLDNLATDEEDWEDAEPEEDGDQITDEEAELASPPPQLTSGSGRSSRAGR